MSQSIHEMTAAQLLQALSDRSLSAPEVTSHFLQRIASLDTALNCFTTICEEQATAAAVAAQNGLTDGQLAALAGLPLAHKDIFCTKGVRTACGSKMLDSFVSPYDATLVSRLKAAGTVMLGKTNMDEFAMGSSNETSYYGPVRNPWNTGFVPGGSSGGSAAAVAAGLAPVATGTDTGGSIRQPAALCGITGIKPTYGRVSRYGMIAFASSLDQAGVFARTAEDAALVLREMSGFDERDSTSADQAVPDFQAALTGDIRGLRIGLPAEYLSDGLDPGMKAAFDAAVDLLATQGAEPVPVSLPHTELAVPTYYVVAPAEASSNLSRFDGVRYGHRCDDPRDLQDLYTRSRGEGFGREVQRRIMIGTYALSSGYYDAYYLKAQKVRRLIADDFRKVFDQVDVILSPTTQGPAFPLGDKMDDPVAMYLNDIYTIPANLAGLPGISVPCGFSEGLPLGMQCIGPWFEEGRILNLAHAWQQVSDWHLRRPEGYA